MAARGYCDAKRVKAMEKGIHHKWGMNWISKALG